MNNEQGMNFFYEQANGEVKQNWPILFTPEVSLNLSTASSFHEEEEENQFQTSNTVNLTQSIEEMDCFQGQRRRKLASTDIIFE